MEFKRTAPPSIIFADFFITWIGSRFFAAFIRTFNFVLFRDLLSLFSCCWAKRNKFTTLWCGCFEIINLSNATQLVLFFLAGWARRPIAQFSRSHFFSLTSIVFHALQLVETEAAYCLGNRGIDDDCHVHAKERILFSLNDSPRRVYS